MPEKYPLFYFAPPIEKQLPFSRKCVRALMHALVGSGGAGTILSSKRPTWFSLHRLNNDHMVNTTTLLFKSSLTENNFKI